MALNQRNKRKGLLGRISTPKPKLPSIDLPKIDAKDFKPDSALKAIAKAAGEVAQRSHRVGDVATEVQKASDTLQRKALSGGVWQQGAEGCSAARSPIGSAVSSRRAARRGQRGGGGWRHRRRGLPAPAQGGDDE